jgi:hypothetical protein
MKRYMFFPGSALIALSLIGSAVVAEDNEGNDYAAAITSGKASIDLRYRYEFVDQDGLPEDANASTLRFRLNYKTGQWNGWSAFGEFDHVFHVLLTDFDSGGGNTPDKAGVYPVVADPKGSDLNQLYLDYKMDDDWKFRLGRQRILLDNQRFVGGVGWRQNEQTYDAFTLNTNALQSTALSYSYVTYVRRIFGDDVGAPAGKNNVDTHLLNARVTLNDEWSVVPYAYYIDNKDIVAFSTATVGARLAGSIKAGESNIALVAEFATQSDVADNPVSYDAQYFHFDALWSLPNGLSLGLGYESLGGHETNVGEAFRTPLATLHKFQGWADKFLATPNQGIDDLYLIVKYKWDKWNFKGSAESGSSDFGTEFDVSAAYAFGKRYSVLLKGAFFSTDAPAAYDDTTKFWVMLTASY